MATVEDRVRQWVYAKDQDRLTRFMVSCTLRGKGTEAEVALQKIIGQLEDHDLVHYWLQERCPCQDHPAKIVVEAQAPSGKWLEAFRVMPGMQLGSLSSESGVVREVYVFGFEPESGRPGLWVSRLGMDMELGTQRRIDTSGLDLLSNLETPYEVVHYQRGEQIRMRFRLDA